MQLALFDYNVGDKVILDDGAKGQIESSFVVELKNLWYNGDQPLPPGTTVYKIALDIERFCYAVNETIKPV